MKLLSLPKIVWYKLFGLKIKVNSGAIIRGFPILRHKKLIKIGENFQLGRYTRLSGNIEIGNNVFINEFGSINASVSEEGKIIFGNDIMCGPGVFFQSGDHPFRKGEMYMKAEGGRSAPIIIGNNVRIGAKVIILKGVTIGDNTVVGAGSVVTKPLPSGVLAVGNPCRIIKEI
ncbi:MAG: hypothetical protein HG439_002660 [candidate division SR1 bacterium]|nr:hypothetical protein [candidate division SR1 bacterium]